MPEMNVKRGIIQSFNAPTYTASVLLFEATSHFLSGVPVANHIDGTSCLVGALCAVLFFDEQNYTDAIVLATYANGSQGLPTPAPGRVTFVTGYRHFQNTVINAGVTQTVTLAGNGGIPSEALGVIYKAYFTSPTVGAYINLAPGGASDVTAYGAIGNIAVANGYLDGAGVLQLDANGRIDVKANVGQCTVTLYTHGYIA